MPSYHSTAPTRARRLTLLAALLLTLLIILPARAQTISVSNFYLDEKDLTANSHGTKFEDSNGDPCALIRLKTTQKGFSFEFGTNAPERVDEEHKGEIWIYVQQGVRRMSIHHALLGNLTGYEFPKRLEKAKTYVMEITTDKVFTNTYDDKHKKKVDISVTPATATFTLNGMNVPLDARGRTTQKLSYGTYTYKVEADNFYPKEDQLVVDDNTQPLVIDDLKPVTGRIRVQVAPANAAVTLDGAAQGTGSILVPREVQTGTHKIVVRCNGYKTEERAVVVRKDETADVQVELSPTAVFTFHVKPSYAYVYVDGEQVSGSQKELKSGTYEVKARWRGYKEFKKQITFNSAEPEVNIRLSKIYNYKRESYLELGGRAGSYLGVGGAFGFYFSNVNVEAFAYYGLSKSEKIYWTSEYTHPSANTYSPLYHAGGKVGYGFPIGTRFRLTPQVGGSFMKLVEKGGSMHCDGAYVISGIAALRVSYPFTEHLGVSLTPEYAFALSKSDGFKALESVSSQVKRYGSGFSARLAFVVMF